MDGACHGNPGLSAGGGIVRDHSGNMIYGFHSFYGHSTSIISEARSLLHGIKWLQAHGHMHAIVEIDSKVLLDSPTLKTKPLGHVGISFAIFSVFIKL